MRKKTPLLAFESSQYRRACSPTHSTSYCFSPFPYHAKLPKRTKSNPLRSRSGPKSMAQATPRRCTSATGRNVWINGGSSIARVLTSEVLQGFVLSRVPSWAYPLSLSLCCCCCCFFCCCEVMRSPTHASRFLLSLASMACLCVCASGGRMGVEVLRPLRLCASLWSWLPARGRRGARVPGRAETARPAGPRASDRGPSRSASFGPGLEGFAAAESFRPPCHSGSAHDVSLPDGDR